MFKCLSVWLTVNTWFLLIAACLCVSKIKNFNLNKSLSRNHDIQGRNNIDLKCKDLVSWVVWPKKLWFSFLIFFDENDIAKLDVDNALCGEIVATDSQLSFS